MTNQERLELRFAACYEAASILSENGIIGKSNQDIFDYAKEAFDKDMRDRDRYNETRRKNYKVLNNAIPVKKKMSSYENYGSKYECCGRPGCVCYSCNSGGLSGGYRYRPSDNFIREVINWMSRA